MSRPPWFTAAPRDVRPLVDRLPSVAAAASTSSVLDADDAEIRPLFARGTGVGPAISEAAPHPDDGAARARAEAEARAAAEAEVRARVEALEARYLDGLQRLDRAMARRNRPPVAEVVELALIAAREIVGRELAVDRDLLLATVAEALHAADDEPASATVRLAPTDLAWIRAHHPARFGAVRLIEDARLQPGGCVVDTARRVVDASLESRLAAVRRAVAGALAGVDVDVDAAAAADDDVAADADEVTAVGAPRVADQGAA